MKIIITWLLASRWRTGLMLGLVVIGCYANTTGNPFQYDDMHVIVENPHIQTLDNLGAYFKDPTLFSRDADKAMYRPLLLVSLALNYAWSGTETYSYHWVNILLHGVCCLLVWGILTGLSLHPCMALLGALLFLVHPICTEPVNYISSRATLLAAVGVCGAFLLYVQGKTYYWAAPIVYLMALFSKESAIVLPGLLVIYDYSKRHLSRGTIKNYIPFAIISMMFLWHSWSITGFLAKAVSGAPLRTWDVQLGTQVKALVYYTKLLILPTNLNLHHGFVTSSLDAPVVLLGVGLLISLGWWGWKTKRYRSTLGFGLAWCFVALVPTLVIPLNILVNEHRLYIPLVGVIIVLSQLPRLERLAGLIWGVPLVIFCMGVMVWQRNQVWADPAVLWADAVHKAPLETRPYVFLGNTLDKRGQHAAAVLQFNKALLLEPDNLSARNNLGLAYLKMGQLKGAEAEFKKLLGHYPDLDEANYNLGQVAQQSKVWPKALAYYAKVASRSRYSALALNNRGTVHEQSGRLDSALFYYNQALKQQSNLLDAQKNRARHRHLLAAKAESLLGAGQTTQVEFWCRQVLEFEPANKEALFFLAVGLLLQGEVQESIEVNQHLVKLYPDDYHSRLQLANALEGHGLLDAAQHQYDFLIKRYNDSLARDRRARLLERKTP